MNALPENCTRCGNSEANHRMIGHEFTTVEEPTYPEPIPCEACGVGITVGQRFLEVGVMGGFDDGKQRIGYVKETAPGWRRMITYYHIGCLMAVESCAR